MRIASQPNDRRVRLRYQNPMNTWDPKRSKFAVFDHDTERVLLVFPDVDEHIQHVRKWIKANGLSDDAFVGAGKVENERVFWKSDSCMTEYKKDRPSDHNEAAAVLGEVRGLILDWLNVLP